MCAGILHYSQATHIPPWHSQSSASRMVCGKDKGRGCSDYIYWVFARTHRHAHTWPFVFSSLESSPFPLSFVFSSDNDGFGDIFGWIMANGSAATSIWYHSVLSTSLRLSVFVFSGIFLPLLPAWCIRTTDCCRTMSRSLSFWILARNYIEWSIIFFHSSTWREIFTLFKKHHWVQDYSVSFQKIHVSGGEGGWRLAGGAWKILISFLNSRKIRKKPV